MLHFGLLLSLFLCHCLFWSFNSLISLYRRVVASGLRPVTYSPTQYVNEI